MNHSLNYATIMIPVGSAYKYNNLLDYLYFEMQSALDYFIKTEMGFDRFVVLSEEILELTKEELKEELITEELLPQPPLVSPQPAVRVIATHTVRPNETLSHIALRYYGHATPPYYRLIYEFNRDVIGNNMNFIIPGQVLRIPSLPEDLKK